MTLQSEAMAQLWADCYAVGGVSIIYDDGDITIAANAIPGVTTINYQAQDGMVQTLRFADFLIDAELLGKKPEQGDRVSWDGRSYEVNTPTGVRHFEEVGPHKQLYRIHTREISEV